MKDYLYIGWLPERGGIPFMDDHDSCITEWTSEVADDGSRVCVALNRVCGAYHVTVDHFDGDGWCVGAPEIFDTCADGLAAANTRINEYRRAL